MIIIKKTVCLLALLMLLPLIISACGNNNNNVDATSAPDTTAADINTYIVEDGISEYTIIYPENCGSELFSRVTELNEAIKTATGAELPTHDDFIRKGDTHDTERKEILIGRTNYTETEAALAKINYGDYIIEQNGNKIVIAAYTDTLLYRAVKYYISNLIEKNLSDGGKKLMFEPYSFIAEYKLKSLKIDGNELSEYTIIYESARDGYGDAAEKLAACISEKYGKILPIYSDSEKATPEGKEILIGRTNRAASERYYLQNPHVYLEYSIAVSEGNLIIAAGGPYSALLGANRIQSKYLVSGEEKIEIKAGDVTAECAADKTDVPLTAGADIRVMTANILAHYPSWSNFEVTPVYMRAEIFAANSIAK